MSLNYLIIMIAHCFYFNFRTFNSEKIKNENIWAAAKAFNEIHKFNSWDIYYDVSST